MSTHSVSPDNHGQTKVQVESFLELTKEAEFLIRDNYLKGRIPPDCRGDGWSEKFELAYQAIEPHLPRMVSKFYQPPHGTAYRPIPFEAKNPVEALMFLLNPADEAFGEPGYLESSEYREIKSDALRLIDHALNPPKEFLLTPTESDLVNATTRFPQSAKRIAYKANCSYEAARKCLPGLCRRGFVIKAPKNGYYRLD